MIVGLYRAHSLFFLTGRSDWSYAIQAFLLVIVCALVCVGTYYLNKRLSRARLATKSEGNLYLYEVISVGANSTVQLIKAGERYVLIGVTRDRIVFLTEIPQDEIKHFEPDKGTFDKYFQRFLNKQETNKQETNEEISDEREN